MTDDPVKFAYALRRFSKEYLTPNDVAWREQKQATREAWLKAGELGMIVAPAQRFDRVLGAAAAQERAA
jgi:hypothetical protein